MKNKKSCFYDILDENEERKGRKRKNINEENNVLEKKRKRYHTKYKKDNIRSVILTSFISFIVSFLNDYGKKFINQKQDLFKKFAYKLRAKSNSTKLKEIMMLTLKEYCELKVSSKHKKNDNLNFNSISLLSNYFGKDFLNLKLYQFYENFYLVENSDKFNIIYNISEKTENFQKLLEKFNDDVHYQDLLKITGKELIRFCFRKKKNEENQNNNINFNLHNCDNDSFYSINSTNFNTRNISFDFTEKEFNENILCDISMDGSINSEDF